MKIYVPPIKLQGIKTKLVLDIKNLSNKIKFNRWVEPFMGSGVVAFNMDAKNFYLADNNPHLINFYNNLKLNKISPKKIKEFLYAEGQKLEKFKDEYYYEVRERFNRNKNSLDFLFLNRAGFNGMIRFNKKGNLNIPFCKNTNRFSKSYITKIYNQSKYIYDFLKIKNVLFKKNNYLKTIENCKTKDLLYCDPPYLGRHVDYFNSWNKNDDLLLIEKLKKIKCYFILSTWHSNNYRKNELIKDYKNNFNMITKEHFYHVGGSIKNRGFMKEALIYNF
jgi:DNA adenine methylase